MLVLGTVARALGPSGTIRAWRAQPTTDPAAPSTGLFDLGLPFLDLGYGATCAVDCGGDSP